MCRSALVAELLARLFDHLVAALLAHGLGAVVGVAAGAVPVALGRLGVERDVHAVVLGDACKQPAGHVQVVARLDQTGRSNLELPLAGHDLGVDARDLQARRDARVHVLLDDGATDSLGRADAAVVRTLGRGLTLLAEAVGTAALEQGVLLLETEPGLLALELLLGLHGGSARVGLVGRAIGVVDLGEHQQVLAAADWVRAAEHRLEHAVGRVALGLVRGGAVEAPLGELRSPRAGSSSSNGALASARCRRSRCIQL